MTTTITRRRLAHRFSLAAGGALVAPNLSAAPVETTPSQTEGPFYPVHTALDLDADLTRIEGTEGSAAGDVILVSGHVYSLEQKPLRGALVDVWQANHHGKYIHPRDRNPAPLDPSFQGWAQLRCKADGSYRFKTILPGPYSLQAFGGNGMRCRHIHFKVSQPGFRAVTTQMYFAGDPLIETDGVMANTPVERRQALIAHADESGEFPEYRFDLFLDTA